MTWDRRSGRLVRANPDIEVFSTQSDTLIWLLMNADPEIAAR